VSPRSSTRQISQARAGDAKIANPSWAGIETRADMTQRKDGPRALEPAQSRHETATAVVDDVFPNLMAEVVQAGRGHDQISTAVVHAIAPDGIPTVILSGESRPREASTLLQFSSAASASKALLGRTVLVVCNPDASPIIMGVVAQRLWNAQTAEAPSEAQARLPVGETMSVQLDKRQIDLQASDEIRLTCGKSSLVMRRDGTVIVRGVKIVSRATESNKIRGGTVSVN
jgi:hypothetical protein